MVAGPGGQGCVEWRKEEVLGEKLIGGHRILVVTGSGGCALGGFVFIRFALLKTVPAVLGVSAPKPNPGFLFSFGLWFLN